MGVTYDDLGDLSEDLSLFSTGKIELIELKDRVKDEIRSLGPEAAQELADRMFDEGEISEEAHESISRQVRLLGK